MGNKYITVTPYLNRGGKSYYLNALTIKEYSQGSIYGSIDTDSAVNFVRDTMSIEDAMTKLQCELSFFIESKIEPRNLDATLTSDEMLSDVAIVSISYPIGNDTYNRETFIVVLSDFLKKVTELLGPEALVVNEEGQKFLKHGMSDAEMDCLISNVIQKGLFYTPRITITNEYTKKLSDTPHI